MPTFENGVHSSMTGLMTGLLESTAFTIAISTAGALQPPLNVGVVLLSLVAFFGLARRMNYWGIAYTFGWFITFVWIAPSVLSGWELGATELLGIFYLALKFYHKAEREL